MAGSSRSVRRVYDITPSTINSRLRTVAKTGRSIEISDRRMAISSGRGRRADPCLEQMQASAA